MWRALLAAALLLLPVAARANWVVASSEHFTIYANADPEKVKAFATDLERFDRALHLLRAVPDFELGRAARITVFVMPNLAALQSIASLNATSTYDGVAGFYVPRAGDSVAFVPAIAERDDPMSARDILQHEYTHHFMFTAYPGAALPAWVTEGYAEFHASAKVEKDGSVLFGAPPQYRANGLLWGDRLSIADLLGGDTSHPLTPGEVESIYGRGWLLTHFLTFDDARKGQLAQYLIGINRGLPPLEAAKVFGDLKLLDKQLVDYMHHTLPGSRVPAAAIVMQPVTVRPLGRGEAAMLSFRMRLERGVSKRVAATMYSDLSDAAAAYPGDAFVQTTLAQGALAADEPADAERAADRALAAEPGSIEAQIAKGRAEMAAAAKAGTKDGDSWARVRTTIIAANHLDPDDPRPLIDYYASFGAAGQAPSQNAKLGLQRAFAQAPEDTKLRQLLIRQLLIDSNAKGAHATLAPLAYAPHGGKAVERARKLMATLDKSGTAAALKEMDAWPKPDDPDE